jgi:phage gpG-like protein
MRLLLDVAGDRQLDRTLLRMAGRADDMSDALGAVGDMLAGAETRQFSSQGTYASGGWAPLAPSTLARKAALGQGDRILVATGELRDSLTRRTGGGNALREVTPSSLVFGTTVPYARFHQQGTGRMPQRRPLELTEGDRRQSVRILQRFVTDGDR